ncbi:MAG: hypothetical protein O9262_04350, partial [Cyclobacteriaceae bacterium]|nr:hypothetical protein [Cyclobacteriaceae bacterium]
MNYRSLIIITYLIAFRFVSDAQTQLRGISPIPQTPNAMAFAKHGDVPIGHYTGTMNFNIPLYTIKIQNFEFPMSVSYSSSGIRVAEEAGPVGLGWALNAGGMITHIVNDRNDLLDPRNPDEGYIGNVMPNHGIPNDDYQIYSDLTCYTNNIFHPFISTVGISNTENGPGNRLFFNCELLSYSELRNDFNDTESDMFSFNFGGYSGKFFYHKPTGTFQTLDRSKLRITYTPASDLLNTGESAGWNVITEDGTTYRFNKAENHEVYSSSIGSSTGSSLKFVNYLLSSITLANGQE